MPSTGLTLRMAFVSTVIAAVYYGLVRLGMAVGLTWQVAVAGLALVVLAQYWVGAKAAVSGVDAVPIPEDDFAAFVEEYERGAEAMGFDDPPRLLVARMGVPNAFAVGRKGKGTVVLSVELLELLDFQEVAAVAAHELAHLRNRDSILMVLGTSAATVIGLLMWLTIAASDNLVVNVVAFAVGVTTKFLVTLFVLALSRSREYTADATAASVLHSNETLASALRKIEAGMDPERATVPNGVSALCVTPFDEGVLATLLSTHTPTEKRIERLRSE